MLAISRSSVCATLTRTAHTVPTKREMGTIGFEPMLRHPGISVSATCPHYHEMAHVHYRNPIHFSTSSAILKRNVLHDEGFAMCLAEPAFHLTY